MKEQHSFFPTILDSRAIYRVEGVRSLEFLQGALTSDVRRLSEQVVGYGLLLQPQGKIIADVFLFNFNGAFLLDLPLSCESEALSKLKLYATGRGVVVKKEESLRCMVIPPSMAALCLDDLVCIAVSGEDPRGRALGRRVYIDVDRSFAGLRLIGVDDLAQSDRLFYDTCLNSFEEGRLFSSRADDCGFSQGSASFMNGNEKHANDVLSGSGHLTNVFDSSRVQSVSSFIGVSADCPDGLVLTCLSNGEPMYRVVRTIVGAVEVGCDYAPNERYPLDLALDTLGAVSFTKGCYAGQEVTARMRSRAVKRKRLCLFMRADGVNLESCAQTLPSTFFSEDGSSFHAEMMRASGSYVLGVVPAGQVGRSIFRCRSECGLEWFVTSPCSSDLCAFVDECKTIPSVCSS